MKIMTMREDRNAEIWRLGNDPLGLREAKSLLLKASTKISEMRCLKEGGYKTKTISHYFMI